MVAVTCTWLLFLTALSQVAVLVYSQTCSSFCGVCLDCEGNFRDLADVIPVFPRPTVNDQPINPPDNTLQFMGNDVLGCNEVQSQIFYYDDDCNLLEVPGDNIIYATLSNIQGRNLFNQNEANWDTIEGHVLNVTVQCQNQLRFCVLFGLGINGSVVVPTNSTLAPGPQPTTTPTWTLGPTSLPSPGPPWPTADDDDQAPLLLTVTISSPTSVFLSWEISSELDSSARSNIRSVRIEVLAVHDQSGEELQSFEIILPVQPNEYEYHFLHCGINAMFTISVNDTFSGVNGGVFPPGAHSAEVFLPDCPSDCNSRTGFSDDACLQYCICTTLAFSGHTCEDPQYYPRDVAVWPTSNRTLHIEWSFKDEVYTTALAELRMRLRHFQVEILRVSNTDILRSVSVNINSRSYDARQIELGVEYYVTVSTVAADLALSDPLPLVANASAVRALIDENLFTADPTLVPTSPNPCSSPQDRGPSPAAIAGPVLGTALVVGLISVIVTVVCMRKMGQASAYSREKMIVPNPLPVSSNGSLHSRNAPRTEPNPAYGLGTSLHSVNTRNSTSIERANDTNTGISTGTFTYDYISMEF